MSNEELANAAKALSTISLDHLRRLDDLDVKVTALVALVNELELKVNSVYIQS